jgi:predicted Fe-Mo cluster-binding NifX family protein
MTKIAVPSRTGMVDEHFGHCAYFTVFTLGEDNNILSEDQFTPPPLCGCKSNLVAQLVAMGVTTLIAGNMGDGAAVKLRQNGVRVIRGAGGPVRDAVESYLAGDLVDSQEICQAHDHECQHELKAL